MLVKSEREIPVGCVRKLVFALQRSILAYLHYINSWSSRNAYLTLVQCDVDNLRGRPRRTVKYNYSAFSTTRRTIRAWSKSLRATHVRGRLIGTYLATALGPNVFIQYSADSRIGRNHQIQSFIHGTVPASITIRIALNDEFIHNGRINSSSCRRSTLH